MTYCPFQDDQQVHCTMLLILLGLFLSLLNFSYALTLPKLFTNGMVLQGAPENASIWGFLDQDTKNPVELVLNCGDVQQSHTFTPKNVN